MTIPVVRQRAKRPKNRTGCRTCKSRHIRCDEARPACRKCTCSGRQCAGYEINGPAALSRRRLLLPTATACAPSLRMLSDSPVRLTAVDAFAVEFFCRQTTFQLPGWSMSSSWDDLAVKLSRSEISIASGVVALGGLLRARAAGTHAAFDPEQYDIAMRQYSSAVARVRARIINSEHSSSDIEVVLMSCLIFICCEIVQESYEQAAKHFQTGLKMLDECLSASSGREGTISLNVHPTKSMEVIAQAFLALEYDLTMFVYVKPRFAAILEGEADDFKTLDDARVHLHALTIDMHRVRGEMEEIVEAEMDWSVDEQPFGFGPLAPLTGHEDTNLFLAESILRQTNLESFPELLDRVYEVERRVAVWSDAFARLAEPASRADVVLHMMLQVQFMVTWFLTSTWRDKCETKTDQYLPVFIRTVAIISRLLHLRPDPCRPEDPQSEKTTLWQTIGRGSGMIMALDLIATKCRDSATRYQAVSLLERLQLQEGILSSNLLVPFTRRTIEIEEERARSMLGIWDDGPLRCEDVPEEARLLDVTMAVDPRDPTCGRLVCAVQSPDSSGRYELLHESVAIAL